MTVLLENGESRIVSSGSERDPLCGIIIQGGKIVGSICIPEEGFEFIEQFNNCYGPMRMQVSELDASQRAQGAIPKFQFRLPTWYREAWRPTTTMPPLEK